MNRVNRFSWKDIIPLFLLILFAGSIFWINFHSAFWYDMDMALNSHVAKLMWDGKSFFPENWVFGNSFFILESSNLAALFYGLTHQTTLSMSLTSSLWALVIAGTFIWCLKPFVSREGIVIGLLCLLGGIIFGTSAASYTKGFQVLYTMASYYACYLEVLLLSLGCWLRLSTGSKLHWSLWFLSILLNFAVGMHSLREMLILGIPLAAFSFLLFVLIKDKRLVLRKALFLSIVILIAEGMGYLIIKQLNIPASPNIGGIETEWSVDLLFSNFVNSTKNLLRISGLAFIKDGAKYLPLFLCALCVAAVVMKSLVDIIRKEDTSPLSLFILFSWLSIIAVFGVGVFFFKTRDIYFFIYWLLATLSVVYLISNNEGKRLSRVTGAICLIAIINYGYNFIPDFIDYHRYSPQLAETTQRLIDEGYTTLYGDDCAVFAAASHDQMVATPFRINGTSKDVVPLAVFPYNKDQSLYDTSHSKHAVVCFSNYYLDKDDVSSQMETNRCLSCFIPLADLRWRNRHIILCINPEDSPLFPAFVE